MNSSCGSKSAVRKSRDHRLMSAPTYSGKKRTRFATGKNFFESASSKLRAIGFRGKSCLGILARCETEFAAPEAWSLSVLGMAVREEEVAAARMDHAIEFKTIG